jgi:protein-disulfide isomerase
VYRDFPILSLHANAGTYAQASECGDDQGKFWELYDILYNVNYDFYSLPAEERGESPFTVELLQNYSEEAGLDLEELNSCLDSGKYIDEVNNDLADGQFYGVGGTPNMFIVAKKELTDLQLSALNEIASIVDEQAGASYITIYNSEHVTTIHIQAALNYQTVSAILDVLV